MGGNATAAKTTAAPQKTTRLLNLNMREIVRGRKDVGSNKQNAGSQQQDPAYGIVVRVGRVLIFRPAARGRSKNYAVAGAGLVAASTADFLPASH